jgi:hypothetical protein
MRAEPYEPIAYCQARRGNYRLAVQAMEKAVGRDPDNWRLRYGLALVRGAAGVDPLPAARLARRLNPHSQLTTELVRELGAGTRRERRRLTASLARSQRLLTVVR